MYIDKYGQDINSYISYIFKFLANIAVRRFETMSLVQQLPVHVKHIYSGA